jgi:hypothetical protein
MFLVSACGSVAPRSALAGTANLQASSTSAAREFDDAVAAFERGEFARALAGFEAAYRESPHPIVAFNLARVHERVGHQRSAVRYYLAFLDGDTSPDRTMSTEARAAVDRLRSRVTLLRVYAPAGAVVDGEGISPSPYEHWVVVDPGLRPIESSAGSRVVIRATPGDALSIECPRENGAIVVGATTFGATNGAAGLATALLETH